MKPLSRELLAIATDSFGLVTVEQLTRHGLVGRSRESALESGYLTPLHRGVYKVAGHPDSFEQRCQAALLAAPHAVLSGPTAGRLWGLRKVFTEEVHVLARTAIHLAGVTAHRTVLLGPADTTVRDRLKLLTPPRLLCDLASFLDDQALESVLEQMIDRRLISAQGARAAVRRFVAPGRPGSLRLGRVIDSRATWLRPVDSDLELRLWRALSGRGLELERQVAVRLDDGSTACIDLADRLRRFGIEVDHVTWHGGRLDAQRDKQRDRRLRQVGWTVHRVTDDEVTGRLAETVDELLALSALIPRVAEERR